MAVQINLAKTVAAQPAHVFAAISDIVDWPQIISSINSVELLTPGPIRAGTRLRESRCELCYEKQQSRHLRRRLCELQREVSDQLRTVMQEMSARLSVRHTASA